MLSPQVAPTVQYAGVQSAALENTMPRLAQLDGLRGPLSMGVIAINAGLYNAGANTPVGTFLVLSGATSFLAYSPKEWNNASTRAQFFQRRLLRLLPMLLVSTVFRLIALSFWVVSPGVMEVGATSGGRFSFVVFLFSLVLILSGAGVMCRGTACGCCPIDRWPRPCCALFPLVLGTYLADPGWYVGLLLFLQSYFLPKLMARYGEDWRASPPSWLVLLGWALLEALQYGVPLLAFAATHSAETWYFATLWIYLGLPPYFRLTTYVFGLQLGRWTSFVAHSKASQTDGESDHPQKWVDEAKTLVPALATSLVVANLHGFLQPETEMHRPDTGTTPAQWALIHALHPFNVVALFCGLVAAPRSLLARLLASRPFQELAQLSYAIYLLHESVLTLYVFAFDRIWMTAYERLERPSDGAMPVGAHDYFAIVLLTTALAYPVTHWLEPRVASWLRARIEQAPPGTSGGAGNVVQL